MCVSVEDIGKAKRREESRSEVRETLFWRLLVKAGLEASGFLRREYSGTEQRARAKESEFDG